ncbi:MAG: 50S ribosomal protein L4 [Bacteroidales bacterium]|nr:50S ribosomal protein L4 [Bacteroidales bacterium]
MELEVLKITGEKTGRTVSLDDSVFGITPNDHAIYLDVKQYQANQRQGTHKSKERSEVSGSTRKLKRQKGTGTARLGDVNSPVLRGGGRAFGPKPRDYGFKLNKKVKRLARKSALTYKAQQADIIVIEDFSFENIKTKNYVKLLNDLKVNDVKTLLLTSQIDQHIYMSGRNIPTVSVRLAADITSFEVLRAKKLILQESAVKVIEETLNK